MGPVTPDSWRNQVADNSIDATDGPDLRSAARVIVDLNNGSSGIDEEGGMNARA